MIRHMALTQKDVSKIKGMMRGETEYLARLVARGFESVDKRFEQIDKRFEQIDKRFEQIDRQISRINEHLVRIDARLDMLEHDVADIRKHFIYRDEFEDALARLRLVEKKLGIKA